MSGEELDAYLPAKLSKEGKEIARQLLRGFDDITRKAARLGALLVSMSDEDRALFIGGFPAHYRRIWSNLLRVGRGEMHPRLATASGRAAQILQRLPYKEQEQYIVDLIPVVTGESPRSVKHFDIDGLPPELMTQVFAQGGGAARVRSVKEQRDWRARQVSRKESAEEKQEKKSGSSGGPWTIRNGRAFLSAAKAKTGLTAEDVERLRRELKG